VHCGRRLDTGRRYFWLNVGQACGDCVDRLNLHDQIRALRDRTRLRKVRVDGPADD
jgi:hypothetical protein